MKSIKLFSLLFFISTTTFSQVGIGTTSPEAELDVTSVDGGFLMPRYALTGSNDTTTVVNPQGGASVLVPGTIVYNTTAVAGANAIAAGFVYWNGGAWTEVGGASVGDDLGNHTATTTLDLDSNSITNVTNLSTTPIASYDKLRVYSSALYTIGFNDAMTYGYLNDFAMTFTINNDIDRGWIWRDTADAKDDGAMSLTTDGRLTLKNNLNVDSNTFFVNALLNRVGIGTANPTNSFSVNGAANKVGGGAWAVFSDRRLKKDVSKYDEGLDLILKVNPVNFSYNENYTSIFGGNKEITQKIYQGVIAQELQKIAPDMVNVVNKTENTTSYDDGGNQVLKGGEFLEVDPSKFTYALINSVQQQQKQLEAQQKEIDELKKMVQQLLAAKK